MRFGGGGELQSATPPKPLVDALKSGISLVSPNFRQGHTKGREQTRGRRRIIGGAGPKTFLVQPRASQWEPVLPRYPKNHLRSFLGDSIERLKSPQSQK